MTTIIAVGPGDVRRLCCRAECSGGRVADGTDRDALEAIDDAVALVDGRPVAVAALWRNVLRSVACPDCGGVVLVYPSWWSRRRRDVLVAAAHGLGGGADGPALQPRSWLLAGGSVGPAGPVVVEVAERLVACSGTPGGDVVAVARRGGPERVAEEVAGLLAGMGGDLVVDGPRAVTGALQLAAAISAAVGDSGSARLVREADYNRLARSARVPGPPAAAGAGRAPERRAMLRRPAAAVVLLAVVVVAAATLGGPVRHDAAAPAKPDRPAATALVDGRVVLMVPVDWPVQRVLGGPGPARVQVTSPADPEVALHLTQVPVPGETLAGAAERLKRAIDAEPPGVFVDFDPSGSVAGRSAVTYREVRSGHEVRWAVLLDGGVRISVGCQSRPGGVDTVRDVCERAVGSAHAVG